MNAKKTGDKDTATPAETLSTTSTLPEKPVVAEKPKEEPFEPEKPKAEPEKSEETVARKKPERESVPSPATTPKRSHSPRSPSTERCDLIESMLFYRCVVKHDVLLGRLK